MQNTFRELTQEEIMLVAGGLDGETITVTGGGGGGWGPDGPPSDPWGGGGPPDPGPSDPPVDGGGGGGGMGDGTGHTYTAIDIDHDGHNDDHIYQSDDGKMFYSVKDANGNQVLYPVTQMSTSVGNSATASSNLGATGGVPTAGFTYTENTSNGVISFQIDPQAGRLVH